ncbi:MAG: tetratricopeptide repeat protein [Barnesiella sp.]|nr:tetratricopeptide repeat protein [Barnesiella sp.]
MRLRHFISTTILSIFASFSATAQINTDQMLQTGCNALYFEDYIVAIQYFNQVIAAKPHLARPYFFRGWAKMNLDDLNGAEEDVSKAIERNPFISDAYELRGAARLNLGKYELAIADYDHALTLLPGNKLLIYNKALAQEALKDYDSALESFNGLIEKYPSFDGAYIGRSKILLEKKDTAAALADASKAIELNPKSAANAYIIRANIRMSHNSDLVGAEEDLSHVIKLMPKEPGLYINRAFIRYQRDDYSGAMSDFDIAISLDPMNQIALFNRSMLRMEVRDFNNAISDLDAILSMNPDDLRALYNRAMVLAELQNYRGALRDINRLITVFPDLSAAYFIRYDIKRRMGDRTAQSDLDKSIALGKKRIRKLGNNPSMVEVLSDVKNEPLETDTESQEYVAKQFTQLLTSSSTTPELKQQFNNSNIRGRIQDREISIEPEPIFVVTYYSSPTELKPSADYLREIDQVNRTHALSYVLQLTNREYFLTDSVEIDRHIQSIDYYNSYLATHNPRAIDYFGRGMNQLTLHNYEAAASDFERALQLSPDFALAAFMKGVALYRNLMSGSRLNSNDNRIRMARLTEITECFETALRLSPSMAPALFNIGCMKLATSDYQGAMEAFSKAIELQPQFGEAYFNRGYAKLHLGDRTGGTQDLSKAGQLGVASSYSLLKRMSK